jgi:signal recognition particle GTPase
VLVGAGDTFRAGAIDQLRVWAERAGADFVGSKPGTDPAAAPSTRSTRRDARLDVSSSTPRAGCTRAAA